MYHYQDKVDGPGLVSLEEEEDLRAWAGVTIRGRSDMVGQGYGGLEGQWEELRIACMGDWEPLELLQ